MKRRHVQSSVGSKGESGALSGSRRQFLGMAVAGVATVSALATESAVAKVNPLAANDDAEKALLLRHAGEFQKANKNKGAP